MEENNKNSNCILCAENLSRQITAKGEESAIVDSFSYSFMSGEIYTIAGPSGAGKTSLLRLFNRLDEKTNGHIEFKSKPIETYPVTKLRQKIAMTFQIPHLFPGSVTDNIALAFDEESKPDPGIIEKFLKMVGLDNSFAHRNPEKLSVGQQQRIALARSLALNPEILLLDEPTSALDPGAAHTIEDLIVTLNDELNLTVIMVSHNFDQALRLGGISIIMVGGKLVESGKSSRLFSQPNHDITRKFINGELR